MILITGGTGTSGLPIVRELVAAGVPFRLLVRDPVKLAALPLPASVEVIVGDLSDPKSLREALQGVSRALLNSSPHPKLLELQGNFIAAAKAARVRHIVKLSGMGANASSPARFLRLHGEIEDLLRGSSIAYTLLRPAFFFQNLLVFASMAKQGYIYQPAADGRAAFVDVRDIAAVTIRTLTEPGHEGKIYDVTGPKAISYHDVAAALTDVLRKEVVYVDVPSAHAKRGMLEAGIPEWSADGVNELNAQLRSGMFAKVSPVVAEIAGRTPISLDQFAQDYAQVFRTAS